MADALPPGTPVHLYAWREWAKGKPLPVGTPVRISGQRWARKATATIAAVDGPWPDGAYEYLVYHHGPFSGGLGEPAEPSWWASYRTVPILIEEEQHDD